LIDSLKINIDLFSVDNFGYIYTANNDVLVKYNYDLDTFFSSSLKTFFPTSLEVSKSFRVLLFDKERGAVRFLDNTLTPIEGEINLSDIDVLQPGLVCESFNGNSFWVLDEENMQLLKVNQNLEILFKIENLNFLFQKGGLPTLMREYNDVLYIYFPHKGIATFDVFGTLLNYYDLKAQWVQLFDEYIVTLNKIQLTFFKPPLLDKINQLKLTHNNYKKFQISNGKLYLNNNKGIYIYEIATKK
jgi:hypothetical protein